MFNRKFSLFHKLILANVLYSLPVIGLVGLMVSAQNVNIEFGKQETKGDLLQRPLEKTLKSFLVLRSITAQGLDIKDERTKEISATLEELKNGLGQVGDELQFSPAELEKRKRGQVAIGLFEKRWSDFVAGYSRLKNDERNQQAAAFVADVRTMIAHMGDTSNLILDPDLDSYYLMDITLLALPQSQDRIAEVLGYMGAIAKRGGVPTEVEKVQLAVYSALLKQSDLDRITGDMQTVLNEDANFYGVSPTLNSKLQPKIEEYGSSMTAFIKTVDESFAAGKLSPEFAKAGNKAFGASFDSWSTAADELDVLLNKRVSDLSWHKYRALGISLAALLFAFSVLFWVSSTFNKNMRQVLIQLKNAIARTKESGAELVSLSADLSEASTDQASALQETAASIEEINSMVQSTLSNTRIADGTATQSLDSANQGSSSVTNLITAIGEISKSNDQILSQVEQNTQEMGEITRIIAEIGTRTAVINDIVFQTKLLSFNASVEAARAGEHGKGFAVVAEEVGNLAQMSGNAAKEISTMLAGSISKVDSISGNNRQKVKSLLGEGRDKIQTGSDLADACTKSINDILVRVTEVKANVENINLAADQQARALTKSPRRFIASIRSPKRTPRCRKKPRRNRASSRNKLSRSTQSCTEYSQKFWGKAMLATEITVVTMSKAILNTKPGRNRTRNRTWMRTKRKTPRRSLGLLGLTGHRICPVPRLFTQ